MAETNENVMAMAEEATNVKAPTLTLLYLYQAYVPLHF